MKKIIAERIIHNGLSRVTLRFPYDTTLNSVVKDLPGASWSNQMKCWHVSDRPDIITILLDTFHSSAWVDYSSLKPGLVDKIKAKREE